MELAPGVSVVHLRMQAFQSQNSVVLPVGGKATLLRNARLQEAMLIPIMIKCGLSTECAERQIHL